MGWPDGTPRLCSWFVFRSILSQLWASLNSAVTLWMVVLSDDRACFPWEPHIFQIITTVIVWWSSLNPTLPLMNRSTWEGSRNGRKIGCSFEELRVWKIKNTFSRQETQVSCIFGGFVRTFSRIFTKQLYLLSKIKLMQNHENDGLWSKKVTNRQTDRQTVALPISMCRCL